MHSVSTELGRALRRARLRRGMTLRQLEVASRGRYKPSSIASYERGERRISVERLCHLASFLGVDPGRLVSEAVGMASISHQGTIALDRRRLTVPLPDLDEEERLLVQERMLGPGREGGSREELVIVSAPDLERLADDLGRAAPDLLSALRGAGGP